MRTSSEPSQEQSIQHSCLCVVPWIYTVENFQQFNFHCRLDKNILTPNFSQFTVPAALHAGVWHRRWKVQISSTKTLQRVRVTLHTYLFTEVNLHKLSKSAAVVVSHCFGIAKWLQQRICWLREANQWNTKPSSTKKPDIIVLWVVIC